jgi:hypothetical protein
VEFAPTYGNRFNKPYFQPDFPNKNNLSSSKKIINNRTLLPYFDRGRIFVLLFFRKDGL